MASYSVVWSAVLAAEAGTVTVGNCLVANGSGAYLVSTTGNRGSRKTTGIARTAGTGGQAVEIQTFGPVPATVTGLAAGSASKLIVNASGALERKTTPVAGDEIVGWAEADGSAFVAFGLDEFLLGGSSGGGGDYETTNSALTSATGEVDTTDATPEVLATGTAIPTGTTRTVWAEVKCVAGGARATRSFYCKREFNNYGGTVTAGTQQELDGPGNLTAVGSPLTAAEVNIEITGQTTRVEAVGIAATDLRWTFKVETLDMAAPAASGPPFDLATLALTGYWDGEDYNAATGTWPGRASAGTSGSNDLTEATNKPTAGATLNGIQTVDFARASSQKLTADGTLDTYVDANGYGFWMLIRARAWASDDVDANLTDGIFGDSGGVFSLSGRTTGPGLILEHYDTLGADTRATGTSNVGAWQLVFGRYSDTTGFLELSDDGGATWGTPQACIDMNSGLTGLFVVGCEYAGTKFFDGQIASFGIMDAEMDDPTVANIVAAINYRWGTTF